MKIAVASDHMGLGMKRALAAKLSEWGHQISDLGTDTEDRCHYPVFAVRACRTVQTGDSERAVLVCGTGIGMCITAGKLAAIRAVVGHDVYATQMSRRHNDTNVLCLGARTTGIDAALALLQTWLETPYEGGRHDQRLHLITRIEQGEAIEPGPDGG